MKTRENTVFSQSTKLQIFEEMIIWIKQLSIETLVLGKELITFLSLEI